MHAEHRRLEESRTNAAPWRKWRRYLSERPRGTVREDGNASGDAGNYSAMTQVRSRAYAGGSRRRGRLIGCRRKRNWQGKEPSPLHARW